ncbi:GtrA family protein [Actinomyces viscosus]|uniref:GtrA family protein n=1 Tax=Actinomyces viscosus TaxID=1656 RepID=UPI0028EBEDE7|nr:GtrA family protein [Actinomyces viscosus]
MTTTSPALPTPATSPASRPTALSRLAHLRRRIPTVILFATVSFSGWTVDYVLALVLNSLTGSVLYAVVGARIVSCTLGFLLNRRLFRAAPETFWRSAGGYAAVQGGVAATSYAGISVLTSAGAPLWLAKVLVDSTLFIVNYLAQSRLVYRAPAPAEQSAMAPALATAA